MKKIRSFKDEYFNDFSHKFSAKNLNFRLLLHFFNIKDYI